MKTLKTRGARAGRGRGAGREGWTSCVGFPSVSCYFCPFLYKACHRSTPEGRNKWGLEVGGDENLGR